MMLDRTSQALLANTAAMVGVLGVLSTTLAARARKNKAFTCTLSTSVAKTKNKAKCEIYSLAMALLWIGSVVVVIATQAFERWGPWGYMSYCSSCAALYLLVPYTPGLAELLHIGDSSTAWHERYITKANLWIAIFSFIGNYWYTHYFYRVLKAKYTFDAHMLNDVPICLYLMTHAYFMFYHVLSNFAIRFVHTRYEKNTARFVFTCVLVAVMAYMTAVGEAVTIAAFPYYSFEDRHSAIVIGSAFYGIYFLASFPMFYSIDEPDHDRASAPVTYWSLERTAVSSFAAGMIVLCLLDFSRLAFTHVELFSAL
ncbi:cycloeucalenol cycloisomerase [Pycnococcus provasolii]